jgi:Mg-chelatase subunit ChlD
MSTAASGMDFNAFGTPAGFAHAEYLLLFIPLFAFFAWYLRRGGLNRAKLVFLAVRSIIILLVVLALAAPVYYESRKVVQDVPPVTVLVDSSSSMQLCPQAASVGYEVFDRLKAGIGNMSGKSQNVRIEMFSDGNRSAIGDAMYHSVVQYGGEPMSLVLVSDGRNNWGRNPQDMAKIMAETNSTLYSLVPDRKGNDVYIQTVIGDKKIPANTKYDLLVRVGNTGLRETSYELTIYVDNVRKFNQHITQNEMSKDIPFDMTLKEVGIHEVRVQIDPAQDTFPENNVYYRSVEVVDKPKVLLVSGNSTSPLLTVMDKLYKVDVTNRVDSEFSKYSAVIFDNINAEELDRVQAGRIKKYVLEGNGVAFVGGKNSFEYGGYNNSYIESLLPVKSTDKPIERRRDFAVVFLVDISESTEYGVGPDSKIDVEKAVVLNMIRALNANDSVGILAFNTLPYVVTPSGPIGDKYADVEDRILRLKFGGGTDMQAALEAADGMLSQYTTDKYLVIVSDGVISQSRFPLALGKAAQMRDKGIKTFTVGVGFDTDENFMGELARSGGGQYFSLKSNPDTRLKIVFGEAADDKSKDMTPVMVSDEYHYITRSLQELQTKGASVRGFNKVYEKSVSQLLLSTRGGKPILTVWRFGLGRVAAMTTDNGLDWSQNLMGVDSGKVVSGMTNWLIGDLEKGNKVRLSSRDTYLGGVVDLTVSAQSQPVVEAKNMVYQDVPNVVLTRTGVNSYSGAFTPKNAGFYGIRTTSGPDQDLDEVAVNYPIEYGALGVDDDGLRRMAASTGARSYTSAETQTLVEDILKRVKDASTKEAMDAKHLWPYFTAAALALYFLDAAVRRLVVIFQRQKD